MNALACLQKRVEELEKENKALHGLLRKHGIMYSSTNKVFNTGEKIQVFKNYFRAREDVYYKRYFHNKTQTYKWTIVCDNMFQQGCYVGKQSCGSCNVSKFAPLSDQVLLNHFTGSNQNKGIGILPLLKDNTCYFLALDFDEDAWFEDMYSVYKTALRFGFYPVMERSASGMGGHLWFFFDMAIKANIARRFGEFLLQETMKVYKRLSFSSFDRMFPNQDYIPEKGFGNQIALPLRYEAYQLENSAFINELQQKIEQPIEYLATRKKATLEEIEHILQKYQEKDYFYDNTQGQLTIRIEDHLVSDLYVIESSVMSIEKKNLNAQSYTILKRMASMYNPEYFLLQRLHKPIYYKNTPKVLSVFEEDDTYLYLPRGLKEQLYETFAQSTIHLTSKISEGSSIPIEFQGILTEKQQQAVDTLLQYNMGVLKAVPGFGKTVIGLYIMSKFKVSTLIIVPSKTIQDQWEDRMYMFLNIPKIRLKKDRMICKYNGSSKRMNQQIDIATAASLANIEDIDKVLESYGLVLIDECHHAASQTFTHVLRHVRAKRIYGLSATPKRKDGLEKLMYMFCGRIRYETSREQIQSSYTFEQILIPRMTNTRCLKEEVTYTQLCNDFVNDNARNYLILKDINKEYESNRNCIVLSERKEHLYILYDMAKFLCEHVYVITGETSKKERKEVLDRIYGLDKKQYILFATSKLLGEGFDLPSLNTLFLTMPVSDEARITQYTGRIHRQFEGKQVVKVYDYVDTYITLLQNMFYKRLKQYEKEGYQVHNEAEEVSIQQILFDVATYQKQIVEDMKHAKKEIIVFSNKVQLSKLQKYYDVLQEKFHQGIQIHVIVSSRYDNNAEEITYIRSLGATIHQAEHVKPFVLIDRAIVWNADFDILGNNKRQGYATRIISEQFCEEVMSEIIVVNVGKEKKCENSQKF